MTELFASDFALRFDLLLRLLLAAVLGGAVGLERELSGKPAGFRTNLLICVGAALLTELSISIAQEATNPMAADPGRIAAQIVSGIGFLGAGTILQARGSVVGLTTAATLWVVAAIGIAVGARAYVEAIGTTALVVAALVVLGRIEERLIRQRADRILQITVDPTPDGVAALERVLLDAGMVEVKMVEAERGQDRHVITFHASGRRGQWVKAREALVNAPGVRRVLQL